MCLSPHKLKVCNYESQHYLEVVVYDSMINILFAPQNAKVNMPYDTYLRDATIKLYGGRVIGLQRMDISLGGEFHMHPNARINSLTASEMKIEHLTVMDGGLFRYEGKAEDDDSLQAEVAEDFNVRGGGELYISKMVMHGKSSVKLYINVVYITSMNYAD